MSLSWPSSQVAMTLTFVHSIPPGHRWFLVEGRGVTLPSTHKALLAPRLWHVFPCILPSLVYEQNAHGNRRTVADRIKCLLNSTPDVFPPGHVDTLLCTLNCLLGQCEMLLTRVIKSWLQANLKWKVDKVFWRLFYEGWCQLAFSGPVTWLGSEGEFQFTTSGRKKKNASSSWFKIKN